MPSWLDGALGAVQGGLQGYMGEKRYRDERGFEERKLAQQGEIQKLREEVRVMLESMKEEGRGERHEKPSGSVVIQQESAGQRVDAQQAGAKERTEMQQAGAKERARMQQETAFRDQDLDHDEFGDTNERLWNQLWRTDDRSRERNWLIERNQNINVEQGNRRLGQDAFTADVNRRRRAGSSMPSVGDWLDSPDAPEPIEAPPSVMTPPARAGRPSPQRPAQTPAQMAPPPAAGARPPVPGDRPQPQGAAAGRYTVGQPVTLRDGRKVIIKKINADGTFEY